MANAFDPKKCVLTSSPTNVEFHDIDTYIDTSIETAFMCSVIRPKIKKANCFIPGEVGAGNTLPAAWPPPGEAPPAVAPPAAVPGLTAVAVAGFGLVLLPTPAAGDALPPAST